MAAVVPEQHEQSIELGSDAMMRAIVEASVSPFVIVDAEGWVGWASRGVEGLLGEEPEAYVGRHFLEMLDPASHEVAVSAFSEFVDREQARRWIGPPMLLDLLDADGRPVACEVSAALGGAHGLDGAIVQVRRWEGTRLLHDAVDGLAAGEPLGEVLGRLLAVVEHDLPDSVVFAGAGWDGRRFETVVSSPGTPALASILAEEVLAADQTWWEEAGVNEDGTALLADQARSAGYADCWTIPVTVRGDDVPTALLVVWREVEGQAAAHLTSTVERIAGLVGLAIESDRNRRAWRDSAVTDGLTGLPNRAGVEDHLARHVEAARDGANGEMAVLICDLDDFKEVNDERGHDIGDRVLRIIAERLGRAVRDADLVARWGGDEFVVICHRPFDSTEVAERLIAAVNEPITVDGEVVQVGLSVGVARMPVTTPLESLVGRSDQALRQAKSKGRNTHVHH